jgi:large subunit ribosomal protein L29
MKTDELRDQNNDELNQRIAQAQEELFRLRFRSATQQLENPSLIRKLRRDVARMKTILRQRELTSSGVSK